MFVGFEAESVLNVVFRLVAPCSSKTTRRFALWKADLFRVASCVAYSRALKMKALVQEVRLFSN